ncbi:uncharacterized protein EDB91DRAFT_1249347 [Suillus paluster]|uniref:uncharacterized protein n=1 Tax=Suillus paluster TaxID=48578 RepID=UPI001B87D271|nr:uncharacterized protein EDB91DRAFT_1249347 [Suillus paluster]KAG1738434.1 hypothetical protein EDB91DRAFT_1249347 [Suillus paluster]
MSHPVIMVMEEAINNFVAWSNDIFSYNVEQFRHDTHMIIVVLMHRRSLDLRGAVDYAGLMCKGVIQRFVSWVEELDR